MEARGSDEKSVRSSNGGRQLEDGQVHANHHATHDHADEHHDQGFDQVDPDEKVSLAMRTCEEIMGKDPRVISANASYSDEKDFKYMIASNGFEGRASGSSFSLMGSVSIKGEDDARPESYWYDSALYYSELKREGIGTKALERALRKLGQRKVASGKYTMVVDNLNAATLLSPLVGAMYGSSIQQRNSFLLDRLGEKVVGDNVTITDTFNPVLRNISVTYNGNAWTETTNYTYNETTGAFATVAGQITVPAATFAQNAATGVITTTPGTAVVTVTGNI